MSIDFFYFTTVVFYYLIGSFSDFVFVSGTLHNKKEYVFSCLVSYENDKKTLGNSSVKTFVKSY